MDKAIKISRTTVLTEKQALDIYSLTGSWDKVLEWAILANKGITYNVIRVAISCGVRIEDLDEWLDLTINGFNINQRPPVDAQKAIKAINDIIRRLSLNT